MSGADWGWNFNFWKMINGLDNFLDIWCHKLFLETRYILPIFFRYDCLTDLFIYLCNHSFYLLIDRFVDLCSNLFIYFDRCVCINFKHFRMCLWLIVTDSFFSDFVLSQKHILYIFFECDYLAESLYFIFHLCICFINWVFFSTHICTCGGIQRSFFILF